MSASDWEEVKRLAADFQRAQLSSSVQRLSERNCIEIINKLIERKEIEVIFTTDGKEYITPQHLVKEMKDELFVHNGRINLVELAKILSIDLSVISKKAHEIESLSSVTIVNGQMIDQSYITSLCHEINDRLKEHGQVNIADLTSAYDLPSDFLRSTIERQLGKIIKAKQDKQDNHIFFTEDFIECNKCKIRGALLGLTKPISVGTLLSLSDVQERIFFSIMEELIADKSIPGTMTGSQGTNSVYIPSIYLKSQMDWVNKFYEQNGYLEFSALSRLGISDPVSFIKRHFSHADIILLASCAAGPIIMDQVDAAIDDVLSTGTFIDVMTLLPSVFEEKDVEVILNNVIKKKTSFQSIRVFNSTVVVTEMYLRNLINSFGGMIEAKAQDCVKSGAYAKYVVNMDKAGRGDEDRHETKADRKEERRRKAAEGKGGGGVQGRETRTKSTKKKYNTKNVHDDDDDDDHATSKAAKTSQRFEMITMDDVREVLSNVDALEEETSEELIEAVAEHLHPVLNRNALEAAKACHESSLASSYHDRRKKHNELQEKLNDLVLRVRLFEKGYKQFPAKDVQQQLAKYLLKTICTDIANEVFAYVAQDNLKLEGKEMTADMRSKILNEVPNDIKENLLPLHKSLTSTSVDDFLNVIDGAVGTGVCDILLKKLDKKRERPELVNHRQQLIELLNVSTDPALVLHLTSLLVFQGVTQTMLHASGKFVSTILSFLQPSIPNDTYSALQLYYDVVQQGFTSTDPEDKSRAERILEDEMQSIKDIALSFKKGGEKSRLSSE